MKTRWMAALSVLSVAVLLGTGFAYVVAADGNTGIASSAGLKPLLTEQQLSDLRAMMDELRANSADMNQTMALVEAQVEQDITENLQVYNLTDGQIAEVLGMFKAIDDKIAEIRQVALELREQGSTFDQVQETIDPMMQDLSDLQDQIVITLNGYGISFDLPQPQHDHGRPEGSRPQMEGNSTSNCTIDSPFPQTQG